MANFAKITSPFVVLPISDIDTDQIIPARFLKTTDKIGLGEQVFADWRYEADGKPKTAFILNQPQAKSAKILVAGNNFGCGSSREHAPWALLGFGFRAVISTRFADIFRNNSLKNGLLPVIVDESMHKQLVALNEKSPTSQLTIDLQTQKLILPDGTEADFPVDAFAKHCLLNNVDELGYILSFKDKIATFEAQHVSS